MNDRKIDFIICVNNDLYYEECCFYINKLRVPTGYEVGIIDIREATCMTAAYNAAMNVSDAKYKVYIHQDTFIVRKDFLEVILDVFDDQQIGLIGVAGSTKVVLDADYANNWDFVSTDLFVSGSKKRIIRGNLKSDCVIDSTCVDGMLIATQVDIQWDDETFLGWDFYDISQCMQMTESGYKIVTLGSYNPFAFHVEGYAAPKNYDKWRKIFCDRYQSLGYNSNFLDSIYESEKYKQFIKDKCAFIDDTMFGIADECITIEDSLRKIVELQKRINDIFGETIPDHDLRIMFQMLNIASKDILEMGYSNMWPINEKEKATQLFMTILFVLWRIEYDFECRTDIIAGLLNSKLISKSGLFEMVRIYTIDDEKIKRLIKERMA